MLFIYIIILLIIAFIFWRLLAFKFNTLKRDKIIKDKLDPLIKHLESKQKIDLALVSKLAEDPLTRRDVLLLLSYFNKLNHFPNEYNTEIYLAESDLVRYLIHPNEVGSVPTKIEFYKTINKRDKKYHIFKYKINNDQKWYVGISGSAIFSSGNYFSKNSVDKELNYIL